MDQVTITLFLCSFSLLVCSATGISVKLTSSALSVTRGQEVELTCTIRDSKDLESTTYIYIKAFQWNRMSNFVTFYQFSLSCNHDVNYQIPPVAHCGIGTNNINSSTKQYGMTLKRANFRHSTNYWCLVNEVISNRLTLTVTNKAECASLNIFEGGEVLTVTEGQSYNGFSCSVGGASPEPEVILKLNGSSSTNVIARRIKSSTSMEHWGTFCKPMKYEEHTSKTTTTFTFIPQRHDDGEYVYCSARNSEMRMNEEVTSNQIHLIVQYGPSSKDMIFKPDADAYTVHESESFTVTCMAVCKPSCTYTWSVLNNVFANTARLSLSDITLQDAGYYRCRARNPSTGITEDKYLKLRVLSHSSESLSTGSSIGIGVAVGIAACIIPLIIWCVLRSGVKCAQLTGTKSDPENHTYERYKRPAPRGNQTGEENQPGRTQETTYENLGLEGHI